MDKYFISYDRDSALAYIDALSKKGFERVSDYRDAYFYILDRNWRDTREIMRYARGNHRKIFLIPHGSRGYMFWDSIYVDMDMDFTAYYVPSWGVKHVMCDLPVPVHVTGWPWCKVIGARTTKLKKVLFAPIHPDTEGKWTWAPQWLEFNKRVWEKLLPIRDRFELIVYHSWPPETNGLTIENNVKYIPSSLMMRDAVGIIDQADVVIAQETFASLAIARGCPTVMIDDTAIPPAPLGFVSKYWNRYLKHAYPLNFLQEDDIYGLLQKATRYDVSEWKNLFIGDNFDEKAFATNIQEYYL